MIPPGKRHSVRLCATFVNNAVCGALTAIRTLGYGMPTV